MANPFQQFMRTPEAKAMTTGAMSGGVGGAIGNYYKSIADLSNEIAPEDVTVNEMTPPEPVQETRGTTYPFREMTGAVTTDEELDRARKLFEAGLAEKEIELQRTSDFMDQKPPQQTFGGIMRKRELEQKMPRVGGVMTQREAEIMKQLLPVSTDTEEIKRRKYEMLSWYLGKVVPPKPPAINLPHGVPSIRQVQPVVSGGIMGGLMGGASGAVKGAVTGGVFDAIRRALGGQIMNKVGGATARLLSQ